MVIAIKRLVVEPVGFETVAVGLIVRMPAVSGGRVLRPYHHMSSKRAARNRQDVLLIELGN